MSQAFTHQAPSSLDTAECSVSQPYSLACQACSCIVGAGLAPALVPVPWSVLT